MSLDTKLSPRPIEVVCAVLVDASENFLAVQRPPEKSLGGLWEFPGGKVEPGEDRETALRRELFEELKLETGPTESLPRVAHRYPFGMIHLWPFVVRCDTRPAFTLTEHIDHRWCALSEVHALNWAPADLPILEELACFIGSRDA